MGSALRGLPHAPRVLAAGSGSPRVAGGGVGVQEDTCRVGSRQGQGRLACARLSYGCPVWRRRRRRGGLCGCPSQGRPARRRRRRPLLDQSRRCMTAPARRPVGVPCAAGSDEAGRVAGCAFPAAPPSSCGTAGRAQAAPSDGVRPSPAPSLSRQAAAPLADAGLPLAGHPLPHGNEAPPRGRPALPWAKGDPLRDPGLLGLIRHRPRRPACARLHSGPAAGRLDSGHAGAWGSTTQPATTRSRCARSGTGPAGRACLGCWSRSQAPTTS